MLNVCDFIQVYVFTTNHHLNYDILSETLHLFYVAELLLLVYTKNVFR